MSKSDKTADLTETQPIEAGLTSMSEEELQALVGEGQKVYNEEQRVEKRYRYFKYLVRPQALGGSHSKMQFESNTILTPHLTAEVRFSIVMQNISRSPRENFCITTRLKETGRLTGNLFIKKNKISFRRDGYPGRISGYARLWFCKWSEEPYNFFYLYPEFVFTMVQQYIEPAITPIVRIGYTEKQGVFFASSSLPNFMTLGDLKHCESIYEALLPLVAPSLLVYSIFLGDRDLCNAQNAGFIRELKSGQCYGHLINFDFGLAGRFGKMKMRDWSLRAVNLFEYIHLSACKFKDDKMNKVLVWTLISPSFVSAVQDLCERLEDFSPKVQRHLSGIIEEAGKAIIKSYKNKAQLQAEMRMYVTSILAEQEEYIKEPGKSKAEPFGADFVDTFSARHASVFVKLLEVQLSKLKVWAALVNNICESNMEAINTSEAFRISILRGIMPQDMPYVKELFPIINNICNYCEKQSFHHKTFITKEQIRAYLQSYKNYGSALSQWLARSVRESTLERSDAVSASVVSSVPVIQGGGGGDGIDDRFACLMQESERRTYSKRYASDEETASRSKTRPRRDSWQEYVLGGISQVGIGIETLAK